MNDDSDRLALLSAQIAMGWEATAAEKMPRDWATRPGPWFDSCSARKARGEPAKLRQGNARALPWTIRRARYLQGKLTVPLAICGVDTNGPQSSGNGATLDRPSGSRAGL